MWKSGIMVALGAAAFGAWIDHEQPVNLFIRDTDAWFLSWLTTNVVTAQAQSPIPITIVDMEKSSEWRALDYVLFLRAIPPKSTAVVVLESLPRWENSAYYRSFVQAALKQPRLILPLIVQEEKTPVDNGSWLTGLNVDGPPAREQVFQSVSSAPPEELRGIVPAGVANMRVQPAAEQGLEVPLYYRLGDKLLPSIAMRAILAARRIPIDDVTVVPGKYFGFRNRKQPVTAEGRFRFDTSSLQLCQRLSAGDLLLRLAGDSPIPLAEAPEHLDKGVIFLGDTSEQARKYLDENGNQVSRTELFASILTSLVNSPALVGAPRKCIGLMIAVIALLLCLLPRLDAALRISGLIFGVASYFWLALLCAQRFGFALPLFLPVSMMAFGFCLAELVRRFYLRKKVHAGS